MEIWMEARPKLMVLLPILRLIIGETMRRSPKLPYLHNDHEPHQDRAYVEGRDMVFD